MVGCLVGLSEACLFVTVTANILVFSGGSLADVISSNESQMKFMSEPELKLLLCQLSQVSKVYNLWWYYYYLKLFYVYLVQCKLTKSLF